MENETIRLVKRISDAGIASRRKAGDLVLAGRVAVNGTAVTEPGFRTLAQDRVTVDGKLLPTQRRHYIMLNKPAGWTCSNQDPHAEKLAVDLIRLPDGARLFSAGRLDRDSEGLILFSNDGDFVQRLAHPGGNILKRYLVDVSHPLTADHVRRMESGLRDAEGFLRAVRVERRGPNRYLFILGEGRKREIRRMVKASGSRVVRLLRIAVGNLSLGDLPPGQWRELTSLERQSLLEAPSPSGKQS